MSLRSGKKGQSENTSAQQASASHAGAEEDPLADLAGPLPAQEDRIFVDNSNLAELKLTCDEAVQRILTRSTKALPRAALAGLEADKSPDSEPSSSTVEESAPFKASHFHEDLRLALGYAASAAIIGVSAWAYLVEKDWGKNKGLTAIAVVAYLFLSAAQAVDAYLQGDRIFYGKRKMLSKRIETELLSVSSPSLPKPTQSSDPDASTGKRLIVPPTYTLDIDYTRRSNGGKSLLQRSSGKAQLGSLGEWFTADGEFVEAIFERRLLDSLQKIIATEGGQ
ncbi:unnamed protein product [Parajaminaea phylloscopi]